MTVIKFFISVCFQKKSTTGIIVLQLMSKIFSCFPNFLELLAVITGNEQHLVASAGV